MKNKRIFGLSIVFCILMTLLLQVASPIIGYAEEDLYVIDTTEEFLKFAKKCSYDAWSKDKVFTLNADISLEGLDFEPIPTFGGTFDGNGHTISGLSVIGSYSPAGLFAFVSEGGTVKNLTVTGCVTPSGSKDAVGGIVGSNSGRIENCEFSGTVIGTNDVGGIVGINLINGTISDCNASGEIIGENACGGIAGTNNGLITSCINSAKVNTICVTPEISLDDINNLLTLDISKLPTLGNTTMSDVGGIAGYSNGMILGCGNLGNVGYNHVGYNIGGIVGRNSGHLSSNRNTATICGRKDVGGIVGQMEPDISYNLSEDLVRSLLTELEYLGNVIDDAANLADSEIPDVALRINTILTYISDATTSLDIIIGEGNEFAGGLIDEVNRTSEILSTVMAELAEIMKYVPEISESFGQGLDELEDSINALKESAVIGSQSIEDIISALEDAAEAFDKINDGAKKLDAGISALKNALEISDINEVKNALSLISSSINTITEQANVIAGSMNRVATLLESNESFNKLSVEIRSASATFITMVAAMSEIYDAITEISENIEIHWSDIEDGKDDIVKALGLMEDASKALISALDTTTLAINTTIDGASKLISAISFKDESEIVPALQEIREAATQLINASSEMSTALFALSDAMEAFDNISSLSDLISTYSDATEKIASGIRDSAVAAGKLSVALDDLIDNIQVDTEVLEDGKITVMVGAGQLLLAIDTISSSISLAIDGINSLSAAVNEMSGAMKINDADALFASVGKAYTAVGTIIDGVEDIALVMANITDILDESGLLADEMEREFCVITEALIVMTESLLSIREGFDSIKNNISFDGASAEAGIDLILEGMLGILSSSENIGNSLLHLADAMKDISDSSAHAIEAIDSLATAVSYFADGAYLVSDMADEIYSLTLYLANVDPIQLSNPSESIANEANKIYIAITGIENELKLLNSDIASYGDEAVDVIRQVNSIFNNIRETIVDLIYGTDDEKIINTEVSVEEISSVTYGKVYNCENLGSVLGDINIGGIAGTIGIESTIDPEDDLSTEISITQKKQYKFKAVIEKCTNFGNVTSKYDYAGGVCGRADFGLIYDSEAFCKVESQSGDYVGGIAGLSASDIISCFAKCSLSGGKYVGGIIGSGVNRDVLGGSSLVADCYSMVVITSFEQYGGAIGGANIGEFRNNYFVSDNLAGIDRISFEGKAEPISYEELTKRRRLPDNFFSFTLTFEADGKVIKSINFHYGDSFGNDTFPEIPKKEGHYGYWSITNLSNLTFDTVVSVIYEPYTTAIGSKTYRENGKDTFLVQGNFTKDDTVIATSKEGLIDDLSPSGSLFFKHNLAEHWMLTIPVDDLQSNKVHFLPDSNRCDIYLKIDDQWQIVDTEEFGSYLVFEVSGENVEIAVVHHTARILPIVVISILGLALIGGAAVLLVKYSKKKTHKAE